MNRTVTVDEYCRHGGNRELNADELERVLDIAENTVDANTGGRLSEYDSFPERVKENIVKAICAQADYIAANFGSDTATEMPQSATIGSFSYSFGGSGSSSGGSPTTLCDTAMTYLRAVGLLYRGVDHAV